MDIERAPNSMSRKARSAASTKGSRTFIAEAEPAPTMSMSFAITAMPSFSSPSTPLRDGRGIQTHDGIARFRHVVGVLEIVERTLRRAVAALRNAGLDVDAPCRTGIVGRERPARRESVRLGGLVGGRAFLRRGLSDRAGRVRECDGGNPRHRKQCRDRRCGRLADNLHCIPSGAPVAGKGGKARIAVRNAARRPPPRPRKTAPAGARFGLHAGRLNHAILSDGGCRKVPKTAVVRSSRYRRNHTRRAKRGSASKRSPETASARRRAARLAQPLLVVAGVGELVDVAMHVDFHPRPAHRVA